MKKETVHYLPGLQVVTPCGIDIFTRQEDLKVTDNWKRVTCGHCLGIKSQKSSK